MKKPTAFYKPYPYFHVPAINPKDEHIARARRTIAFANMTDLTPLKAINTGNGAVSILIEDVGNAVYIEHMSVWESPSGTQFLLNEPYDSNVSQDFDQALKAKGLTYITVPTNLSPYCGKWNDTPGALPWTKSYLICEKKYQVELDAIAKTLSAEDETVPAWNFV